MNWKVLSVGTHTMVWEMHEIFSRLHVSFKPSNGNMSLSQGYHMQTMRWFKDVEQDKCNQSGGDRWRPVGMSWV